MLELAETPFRYHEFLYEYWVKLRAERLMPLMNEVDMAELQKIEDYCFLIQFSEDGATDQYLFRGEKVKPGTAEDADAIQFLFTNPHLTFERMLKEVKEVGKPIMESSEFIDTNNHIVRFRRCLLPLDNGLGKAGYVLGCVRWKKLDATEAKQGPANYDWNDAKLR